MKLKVSIIMAMGCLFVQSGLSSEWKTSIAPEGIISISNNTDDAPNMYGGMISFGGILDSHHQFMFNVGVLAGSQEGALHEEGYGITLKNDVTSVPLQLGYNYVFNLNDRVDFYVGVRAGFVYNNCSLSGSVRTPYGNVSGSKDENSFDPMMGVGCGFKFKVSERAKVYVGYELWQTWMDDPLGKALEIPSDSLDPLYHTIKAGVSFEF